MLPIPTQRDAPDPSLPFGISLLHDPTLNKGTAFTEEEREALGLRGLLPPRVHTVEEQVERVLGNFHRKSSDLERYVFMIGLQDRNEALFYRVVLDHLEEMMPIIYTPTVGRACQEYGHIFRRPRGLYISIRDAGRIAKILQNWPSRAVQMIVVTDGERILGLGDLGANGMGIPVGKLALYTVCAGIHPAACLPVTIDVGTSNEDLLKNRLYIGIQEPRLRGAAYDDLIEEFVNAVGKVFPRALIQFEDFATRNAFRLLARYQRRVRCFNDDVQGTAAVALAGIYSALRITKSRLREQMFVFCGAGEAGTGIANLLIVAMVGQGLSEAEARARCWFVDSRGLVVKSRTDLAEHKLPFAHEGEFLGDLPGVISRYRPTVLIGASGQPGKFTKAVLELMAKHNERPVILALSNPTSKSECTAEEALVATGGKALFASGSPFGSVLFGGKTFLPGQSNNAYIFPGVGLGIVASGSSLVPDEAFLSAAQALAAETSAADIEQGRLYPSLRRIREVSLAISTAVADVAYERGLATVPRPEDLRSYIKATMYEPRYLDYIGERQKVVSL
ncbi:MAG: NAD-dependent malic enzyme [Terrimicrobiaceae bacterium]